MLLRFSANPHPLTPLLQDAEHALTSMIFNPAAANEVEQREPVFATPPASPASPASPPVLLSTHVAEEPITLDLNDAASSCSSSDDDHEGIEDPNAMTVAQMINTIIEDGIVLPTEEEIAGRRAAAGLPAENAAEEPSAELMGMMKEMVELTYNEEERAQLKEDVLEELAARDEAEAEAEAAKQKGKGKGKEKEVVKEPEAGPSTASRAADDSWQGLSRLLGGELLSDRDISTILSREEAAADEAGKPFNMVARMMQYHELNRAAQRTPAEAKQAVVDFLARTGGGVGGKLADEMMDKLKDGVGMSRQEKRAAERKAKKGGKK